MKERVTTATQILLTVFALGYGCWFFRDQPWTPTRVIGLVIMAPSFLLWLVARLQLGGSFAITAKAKTLVTHGLYSRIRSPIYVFGTLFAAGFLLLIDKPAWLAVLLLVVPMQIIRARKEAKVLEEKFGEAYREYRRGTWF